MRSNLGSVFAAALLLVLGAGATATACSSFASDDGPADDSGLPERGEGMVTPPDAGANVDAAADADSGFVALTFGQASCPMFLPCGGDITGAWNFSGGCFEHAIPYPASVCFGRGGVTLNDEKMFLRGTLEADGTTLTTAVELHYSATLSTTAQCKGAADGGSDGGTAMTCKNIGASLTTSAGTAICTDDPGTGGCTCSYTGTLVDQSSVPYTVVAGSTLTTTESTPRSFEFCVGAGRLLRLREKPSFGTADTVYSLTPK